MFHLAIRILVALLIVGCRAPETHEATPSDAASDPQTDSGGQADGGQDAPLPPCAPQMDPAQGLLPANSPSKGGVDRTDVVVNVFSSLVCPHCARLAEIIDILWARPSWNSRVRMYFRHMPVSPERHAATVAAFNQGEDKFWALQDEIYYRLRENGEIMSMEDIRTFAADTLGLDMERFEADLTSGETAARLQADKDIADALGVTGTPSVFICGERIPTSDLEDTVSAYL